MNKNFRHGSGISMKTLKKRVPKKSKIILVPIDGSSNSFRVLQYAIRRADDFSHKLIGVYVIPDFNLKEKPEIKQMLKKEGEKYLNKAKKHSSVYNIKFSSKILSGNPGREIVRFAQQNKVDEIIICHSSKKSSSFLGSVANYVINKTKLPITLVK